MVNWDTCEMLLCGLEVSQQIAVRLQRALVQETLKSRQ
jgi:hypothetical protein